MWFLVNFRPKIFRTPFFVLILYLNCMKLLRCYAYNKEFFITLCRYIFHLPLHLHDAVFVEVCRRIGGKRVGDECTGSILLLFCVESGTDVTTLGSVVGFFDNVW